MIKKFCKHVVIDERMCANCLEALILDEAHEQAMGIEGSRAILRLVNLTAEIEKRAKIADDKHDDALALLEECFCMMIAFIESEKRREFLTPQELAIAERLRDTVSRHIPPMTATAISKRNLERVARKTS